MSKKEVEDLRDYATTDFRVKIADLKFNNPSMSYREIAETIGSSFCSVRSAVRHMRTKAKTGQPVATKARSSSNNTSEYGIDDNLIKYAISDNEKSIIHMINTNRLDEIIEEVGKDTVDQCYKEVVYRAALQGYAPQFDMTRCAPPTHFVKGISTFYSKDGGMSQWVKTDVKKEEIYKQMEVAVNALSDDLPKITPTKCTEKSISERLAVYPIGDQHLGLLAWSEETGQDYDLEKSIHDICNVMDRLVETAPSCEEALIVNLGDWFHSDLSDNRTQRSGHLLDVSDRWGKVLRYGIKAMRQCIESALRHHKKVTIINAIGNHDDHSSDFLSVCLASMYEHEPRVHVYNQPRSTHYYRYHKNLIGVHHGHSIKAANLPLVMAEERKQDWGQTDFRLWLTGHIHHDTKKDYTGCTVESFRTLAARDAYSASHGYMSHRDMKCIVIDPVHGEVERHTVNIGMIQ